MIDLTIIDFETTGLDAEVDEIIEVGVVTVKVADDFKSGVIKDMYGAFKDTDVPIGVEAFAAHGITAEHIKGCSVNIPHIQNIMKDTDIIVAHNAPFDFQFANHDDEFGWLKDLKWADSLRHINWAGHGYKSRNLNYIAADMGFVNPFPHRALTDDLTLWKVINRENYIEELITTSDDSIITLRAFKTPFDPHTKALLSSMKFRWFPGDSDMEKHWWLECNPVTAREAWDKMPELYDAEWKFKQNAAYESKSWEEFLNEYKTV